jgi:hypothetical protein
MDWEHLPETVTRMDGAVRRIGAEPPWMGSRRVSIRSYGFMSRAHRNTPNLATYQLLAIFHSISGTALRAELSFEGLLLVFINLSA